MVWVRVSKSSRNYFI